LHTCQLLCFISKSFVLIASFNILFGVNRIENIIKIGVIYLNNLVLTLLDYFLQFIYIHSNLFSHFIDAPLHFINFGVLFELELNKKLFNLRFNTLLVLFWLQKQNLLLNLFNLFISLFLISLLKLQQLSQRAYRFFLLPIF